ncbi:MAG: 4'-phosphopantetheinyl transferase superfamily protein [Hyellaceae cyanobacterium CSU_1_1]|nr:4'-phosphopantetheinyl transferase superfamily protein [Hyellaceae cyanobacterium CSU_1_1]
MAKFSQVISVEQEIYFIEQNELRSLLSKSNLFSAYERNYCHKKPTPLLSMAGLWCAKQAFIKAIKHKLEFSDFNYLDLEIRHQISGQPTILLHGGLANWFKQQNLTVAVTIAHTKTLAISSVLLWR